MSLQSNILSNIQRHTFVLFITNGIYLCLNEANGIKVSASYTADPKAIKTLKTLITGLLVELTPKLEHRKHGPRAIISYNLTGFISTFIKL
jgi:hypothetical protein